MENTKSKNDLEHEGHTQHEMDRPGFLFGALCDASFEFIDSADQEKIINIYLLSAIGTLGITSGFVCMIDKETNKHYVAGRGLEPDDIKTLENNISKIIQLCFPESLRNHTSPIMEARLIPKDNLPDNLFCARQTMILIQWTINNECLGIAGFGEKIRPETYFDEDLEFLLSLTYHHMSALNRVRSANYIRQLRFNLQQKNKELEDAVKQGEQNRADLDRRLFHLKSFYDIFHELSGLKDTNRIMDTFLLMIIGILSVGQSYILFLDQEEKTARMTCRGIEKETHIKLSQDQINMMISRLFEYAQANNLAPMNARRIADKGFCDNIIQPLESKIEVMFVVNESCLGLIGLGNKITGQSFCEEDLELLMTLVYHFMVFLNNTKSFETIQRLNIDLEKRNIELGKTIADLSDSKHKIEVLERAKARIKSAIQRELEKTARVSVKDILLILCASLLLGLVFNYSNPDGVALIPKSWLGKTPSRIDLHWAKLKHDAGAALFVDARPVEYFRESHIKGAVNLPSALFDFVYMMKFSNLDAQKEIIIYGRNISSRYDEEVLFRLASKGYENVKIFPGGLSAWKKNGFPLEP